MNFYNYFLPYIIYYKFHTDISFCSYHYSIHYSDDNRDFRFQGKINHQLNPTPVEMGRKFLTPPPYQKMTITPKNNDPKVPKLCDFSYISMTNPNIPFWRLKVVKKGDSIAFLLSAVTISGS